VTVVNEPGGTSGGAGVIVTPQTITVTLGGQPVSYTIVLESEPSAAVTLSVHADAPLVVTPAQIVFTPANWNQPQTVTISAIQTDLALAAQESMVRHSVQSADINYNNLGAPTLVVDITEQSERGELFLPTIMH
jgi:hypothetical protein